MKTRGSKCTSGPNTSVLSPKKLPLSLPASILGTGKSEPTLETLSWSLWNGGFPFQSVVLQD